MRSKVVWRLHYLTPKGEPCRPVESKSESELWKKARQSQGSLARFQIVAVERSQMRRVSKTEAARRLRVTN